MPPRVPTKGGSPVNMAIAYELLLQVTSNTAQTTLKSERFNTERTPEGKRTQALALLQRPPYLALINSGRRRAQCTHYLAPYPIKNRCCLKPACCHILLPAARLLCCQPFTDTQQVISYHGVTFMQPENCTFIPFSA